VDLPNESKEDWFVWHPAPAVADIAMEELSESRHERSHLSHIILFPRLMTFTWRKKLSKIFDLVFEIPPGSRTFWPSSEHYPLVVGLTLGFASVRPWQVKFSTGILKLERHLRGVWSCSHGDEWPLLHKFCNTPQRLKCL
jgi:hypothetical protein